MTIRLFWVIGFVACALFASQLAEISWRSALRGADNTYNYLWLRSAMVGGDWDFRDDLIACNTLTENYRTAGLAQLPTATGLIPNKYGIGWAVLSLPFYLVADAIVVLGRAVGVWTLARDGFNPVYQVALQAGHFALAALGLFFIYRVARRWCEPDAALRGMLFAWACSPLLYYQTSNLSMSHNATFLATAACLWALVRAQAAPTETRWWWLAGAAFSLAIVTRFQNAILLVIPAWVCWSLRDRLPSLSRPLACFAIGATPLVALQMWAWKVVYGQYFVFSYGQGGEGFNFWHPAVAEVLFSPFHGLFYWHPMLMVACVGLVLFGRVHGQWGLPLLLACLLNIYVNASWWCWWFGASFGQRAFDASMPAMILGIAWVFQSSPARLSRLFFALGSGMAAINLVVLLAYRSNLIPRNQPVTWWDGITKIWGFIKPCL